LQFASYFPFWKLTHGGWLDFWLYFVQFDVIDTQVKWVDGKSQPSVDLKGLFAKVLFDAFCRFGFVLSLLKAISK